MLGKIIVLDIETTGLNSKKDKIIEIGAVLLEDRKIINTYQTLINPEIKIKKEITELTGISNDDIKNAPKIEDEIHNFMEFIKTYPLVAHNATFDINFIEREVKIQGYTLDNNIIDTLQLSRRFNYSLSNHRLDTVANHFGIEMENYHRALDDAITTSKVLYSIVDLMKEREVELRIN